MSEADAIAAVQKLASNLPEKTLWPELVGCDVRTAKAAISKEWSQTKFQVIELPKSETCLEQQVLQINRVKLYVQDGKIVRVPKLEHFNS